MPIPSKRLERLIRQRALAEHLQQRELAQAIAFRDLRAHALAEAETTHEALLATGPRTGTVDIADLLATSAYLLRLEGDIAARRAALAESEEDVAEERAVLMERRRDRRALELLLERRRAQEHLQRARTEQRRIDDLVAARWRPAQNPPQEHLP